MLFLLERRVDKVFHFFLHTLSTLFLPCEYPFLKPLFTVDYEGLAQAVYVDK